MQLEAHPDTPELAATYNTLPSGDALYDTYGLEFSAMDLPATYRATDNYSEANVLFDTEGLGESEHAIQELRDAFVAQTPTKAYNNSWWIKAATTLKELQVDPTEADNLSIAAKHTLDVVVDGNQTGQGFEVFEVGESEVDREAVAAVFDALKVIDQYSGGLLSADPSRPRIVLANGLDMKNPHGDDAAGGVAVEGSVIINLPVLKRMAVEAGADFHALLSIAVAHETLGHELELLVNGKPGHHFHGHFDYSNKRIPGEIFDDLHESIEPLDPSAAGSRPVREYGHVSPSEDSATSVDSIVAKDQGWAAGVKNIPRFSSSPDEYRSELALRLMQEAADLARQYGFTPGIVGSDVRYVTDSEGNLTGAEPARQFIVTSIGGEEAVREEIGKMIAKYQPGSEFIVSRGDIM